MNSGNPALTTIAPQARQVTLAGQPVFCGKLKLRQKAELQHWLDALPEPNARIKAQLEADGVQGWPLGVEQIGNLLDVDVDARIAFLRITLGPFNPGLSSQDLDRLIDESTSDDELLDILFAAFGHSRKAGGSPGPKGAGPDDAGRI